MVPVTAFFSAVLAIIYLALSVHVIVRRYSIKVAIGDGGDSIAARRIRAHANFAEYVPLSLILMLVNELNHTSHGFLQIMGIMLVAGRLLHALSLLHMEIKRKTILCRQLGMVCTFAVIALLAIAALW